MLYTITDLSLETAVNGNPYVKIVAQPHDPFANEITYCLWGTEKACERIFQAWEDGELTEIEFVKCSIEVRPYQWVDEETGEVRPTVHTKTTLLVRAYKGHPVDDPEDAALRKMNKLFNQGKITFVEEEPADPLGDGVSGGEFDE